MFQKGNINTKLFVMDNKSKTKNKIFFWYFTWLRVLSLVLFLTIEALRELLSWKLFDLCKYLFVQIKYCTEEEKITNIKSLILLLFCNSFILSQTAFLVLELCVISYFLHVSVQHIWYLCIELISDIYLQDYNKNL